MIFIQPRPGITGPLGDFGLALGLGASAASAAPPIEVGIWINHTGKGAVEIRPCGASGAAARCLCGFIVWLKEPNNRNGQPLTDRYNPEAAKRRRTICACGDAGFLKIDLLGLGMLSAVERCIDEVARVRTERIDLSRIPYDDREVYARIQEAETMGVFQIESRAQMQMLKRTRPENLDDLTVQVALVRPGPIIGGAVHPYIEHRKALREIPGYEVPYLHLAWNRC